MGNKSSNSTLNLHSNPNTIKSNLKLSKSNSSNLNKKKNLNKTEIKSEEDKNLSKEKRKHFLNKLTFIKKKEDLIEKNNNYKNSIGLHSYYDNGFFNEEDISSTNIHNFKFSNSFVDEYNQNNEFVNNYFNNQFEFVNQLGKNNNLNKKNTANSICESNFNPTFNRKSLRNSMSNYNLRLGLNFSICNQENKSFQYDTDDFENIDKIFKHNKNEYSQDKDNNDEDPFLDNSSFSQEIQRTSLIYTKNNSDNKYRTSVKINEYLGVENSRNLNLERGNNRKNRKTIISKLINESLNVKNKKYVSGNKRKNPYEENLVSNLSSNDSLCNDFIEANFSNKKSRENSLSLEKDFNYTLKQSKNYNIKSSNYNNRILFENDLMNYTETKNSLFLDLKNQEYFYDINNNNNNNSYSDYRSTLDTKLIDVAKSREKTPVKEEINESSVSLIKSNLNKSENQTLDHLSKSSSEFEGKKHDEVISSELSSVNNSNFCQMFEIIKDKKDHKSNSSDFENFDEITIPSNNKSEFTQMPTSYENKNRSHPFYEKSLNDNVNNETFSGYKPYRNSIISNFNALNNLSSKILSSKSPIKIELNTIHTNDERKSFNELRKIMNFNLENTINNNNSQFHHLNFREIKKDFQKNEYELNFIRSKLSEELRKSYIAKLIYKKIWEPSKKVKNHNSLIIYDWDDTLLCTSFLTPNGVYRDDLNLSPKERDKLSKLEVCVFRLLSLSLERGDVFIITNAAPGWVEFSIERFYPSLKKILSKLHITSARGEYEKDYPGDSRMWKILAFLNMQKNLDMSLITNIICLGDSFIEMEAAQILASKFSKAFIKSIKFRESPKPEELLKQLSLVTDQFLSIYKAIKNLTIRVEKKIKK